MYTRLVITDWSGSGTGSGFTYDVVADTNFMDATPLITIANDLELSDDGGRGVDSVGQKIPRAIMCGLSWMVHQQLRQRY
jgi:hypothetical protein